MTTPSLSMTSLPSIECIDFQDSTNSWKEDSLSSTRTPSYASSPNQSRSQEDLDLLVLNFTQLSKRQCLILINGITLRALTIREYINTQSSKDEKQVFTSFEIALLRSNRLSTSLKNEIKNSGSLKELSSLEEVSKLSFKAYLKFLIAFGDFRPYLLIMAEIYILRAIENPDTAQLIQICGMKVFFGICLLLAFKFSEETEIWTLDQYCNFLGIDAKTLYKYEMFVVSKIFNFELHLSEEELQMHSVLLRNLGDVLV